MAYRGYTENEKRIIEAVKISDYYNTKVVGLDSKFRPLKGAKPTGLCPFHDDTDPSFSYWVEKDIFRCFGCGEAGDVIKLHQHIEKKYRGRRLSREQSMKELAQEYGIELEFDESGELVAPTPLELARQKINDTNKLDTSRNMNVMSISNFRVFNNQIKNNDKLPLEVKIKNYQRLDIMLSAYLMKNK